MEVPKNLKKGDAVAIVATARKTMREELLPAINILNNWGLKPVIGSSIGLEDHQFAGTDIERASDFQNQMDNPEIKALWCARGGYGTVRIMEHLDFSAFRANPKWVIGYSDITVLHAHINAMGIASLHAQMPVQIDEKTPESIAGLKRILFGEKPVYTWESNPLDRSGSAKGALIGGNLSVLYSLCGSPSALNTRGRILFLEDVDEYLYHIDRMLQNLKRNGYFENLSGLVIGGMTAMNDNAVPFGKTADEIIADTVRDYGFPVAFGFPAGHLANNLALPLGETAKLSLEPGKNRLVFE